MLGQSWIHSISGVISNMYFFYRGMIYIQYRAPILGVQFGEFWQMCAIVYTLQLWYKTFPSPLKGVPFAVNSLSPFWLLENTDRSFYPLCNLWRNGRLEKQINEWNSISSSVLICWIT